MKKVLLVIIALVLIAPVSNAQAKFGIKGGLNFNTFSDLNLAGSPTLKNSTGYNFGILLQFKVPLVGLALQPELMFTTKGTEIDYLSTYVVSPGPGIVAPQVQYMPTKATLSYLELPVNIQWGIDLLLFRPYVQVSPFISYALSKGDDMDNVSWDDLNRFDYGVGLGAGVDIWKFQVSGKYNWSLGNLGKSSNTTLNGTKLRGFQLSLAFLF